ncbi:hypothetical protein LC040_07195 [Bacillus tianshenii]|nr:hypothetical protein LC040_07195 [Bacillus tianshenii]
MSLIKNIFSPLKEKKSRINEFDFSLKTAKEKAAIGTIANRIARLLNFEPEDCEELFFQAFSSNPKDEWRNTLKIAEWLYEAIENKENIWQQTRLLPISEDIRRVLIKVFEEYHTEYYYTGERHSSIEFFEKWKVYRDVMYAATQKQFLLADNKEINAHSTGEVLFKHEILEMSDIGSCRERAKVILIEQGIDSIRIMSICLVISEIATNVIKHADKGILTFIEDNGYYKMIVEDYGRGFSLEDLPNTILMAGYSTKKSLGQGFKLVLKIAENVLLYTSPIGSKLLVTCAPKNKVLQ